MRKLIAVIAFLLVPFLCAPTQAAEKVRIGYWNSGVSLGFGSVLEAKDFLAKRGIDAEFVHFPDVNGPIRALAAGSIDLAFGAPAAGVFSTATEGIPIKIFAATQPADVQFVVPQDSSISSLKDLKGKKIGMSPEGSSVAVIASAILSGNYGIGNDDFSLVGGNESRLVQFLAQQQVEGAALRSVTIAQVGDEMKLKRLGSFADEWRKLTHSNAVPYIGVGAVNATLAKDHPERVASVIAALRDALAWGKTHQDEVVSILENSANLPEKDARIYVGQWDAMNKVAFEPEDIDTLKREAQVFAKGGLVKGEINDSLFDTTPYTQSKQLK